MVLAWIVSAIAQKLPLQLCSDDEPKANRPHLGYDAARDETGLLLIYAGTRLPSFFKQSHDEPDTDARTRTGIFHLRGRENQFNSANGF